MMGQLCFLFFSFFLLLVCSFVCLFATHRLVGLVVKASTSRAEDPGFESRLPAEIFSAVESYQ